MTAVVGPAAAGDKQQSGKRKRKRSSSQNADSKCSSRTSAHDKQRIKLKKGQSKKRIKDSTVAVKLPVTGLTGSKKRNHRAKKQSENQRTAL